MTKQPKFKDDKPFTFELVLAERNHNGQPTGRMKESFKTDKVDELVQNYDRNGITPMYNRCTNKRANHSAKYIEDTSNGSETPYKK